MAGPGLGIAASAFILAKLTPCGVCVCVYLSVSLVFYASLSTETGEERIFSVPEKQKKKKGEWGEGSVLFAALLFLRIFF